MFRSSEVSVYNKAFLGRKCEYFSFSYEEILPSPCTKRFLPKRLGSVEMANSVVYLSKQGTLGVVSLQF